MPCLGDRASRVHSLRDKAAKLNDLEFTESVQENLCEYH